MPAKELFVVTTNLFSFADAVICHDVREALAEQFKMAAAPGNLTAAHAITDADVDSAEQNLKEDGIDRIFNGKKEVFIVRSFEKP